ncbi:hypothetical protein GLW07_14255 [Bacillus hwajinpoensis]|uniref:Uncharacterized protein n=1 Tax=Guptibacillus hwajinpoensis TaxID=208199 RepID=A0A845F1D3_9BACL|nr:hypothetical protein [Pseudalkalibacillus hwajinpoensis]MYL64517.1 hypothetical protein [Pseudalkalibacillus hwajinpoensis]
MSLMHEFFLVPNEIDAFNLFIDVKEREAIQGPVFLPDDLISYLNDTLLWIPGKVPVRTGYIEIDGLNRYDVTVFDQLAASKLMRIISSWKHLFSYSDDMLELTGGYCLEVGVANGEYEKLSFPKHKVVTSFEQLVRMGEAVTRGDHYLYHCGI